MGQFYNELMLSGGISQSDIWLCETIASRQHNHGFLFVFSVTNANKSIAGAKTQTLSQRIYLSDGHTFFWCFKDELTLPLGF